jgi:hypothetical protein
MTTKHTPHARLIAPKEPDTMWTVTLCVHFDTREQAEDFIHRVPENGVLAVFFEGCEPTRQ